MLKIILVQGFYPLKTEIARFPIRFYLKVLGSYYSSIYVKHILKISESNISLVRKYSCWRGGYKTTILWAWHGCHDNYLCRNLCQTISPVELNNMTLKIIY